MQGQEIFASTFGGIASGNYTFVVVTSFISTTILVGFAVQILACSTEHYKMELENKKYSSLEFFHLISFLFDIQIIIHSCAYCPLQIIDPGHSASRLALIGFVE